MEGYTSGFQYMRRSSCNAIYTTGSHFVQMYLQRRKYQKAIAQILFYFIFCFLFLINLFIFGCVGSSLMHVGFL